VEEGTARQIFETPRHPYTRGLLAATPRLGSSLDREGAGRLTEIAGTVPLMREPIDACSFAPRCFATIPACTGARPGLRGQDGHVVACCRHERADAA
jgi:peptide/nickel transport system ATP-binding protein